MSYKLTRNVTMWGNISKLAQFDIFVELYKKSHHNDYDAIVRTQHIMHKLINAHVNDTLTEEWFKHLYRLLYKLTE